MLRFKFYFFINVSFSVLLSHVEFAFQKRRLILFVLLMCSGWVIAQKTPRTVYVDKSGVMRWGGTKTEVRGFGVNYTTPFAHAYRAGKLLNISLEKAIDEDVYHFARLGLDLFRVHVWDVEISDSVGNLLNNEHLKLFDYSLKKMKDRGIKFVLTPIAYTGSGYPETDKKDPGFSFYYGGKANCLVNPEAIAAQEKYLIQFLNHVNPYTGIAYKNDPDIIAFEICNEPHHKGTVEETKNFINRLASAMRSTGCKKPIFYNMSHSVHLAEAYINANVQGGTFQWYPSGLVGNFDLQGNYLPHVSKYPIPFAGNEKLKKMAKLVYELDAADIGRAYLYPAMARSLREAGMQVATQFAWDPNFLAYANTSYRTHYMNLAYAPQKALGLKIASEVFHRIPMYKSFGNYPANNSFDVFKVDAEKDLAEMVSENKFIYTNSTSSAPPSPGKLEQVAGFGNSPVVKYEGMGAYFIDKLEEGVWRLEVMPDAIGVRDPFERANFKKEVTVINWRDWPMTINLPDLGEGYTIKGINDGNKITSVSNEKTFTVAPGTYLLTKKETAAKLTKDNGWKNIILKEFIAPPASVNKTYVLHNPVSEISASNTYTINAKIISVAEPELVQVSIYGRKFLPAILPMKKLQGYEYTVTVPDTLIKEGYLNYYISIKEKGTFKTYPSGVEGQPADWDFYDNNRYRMRVVSATSPVYVFDASRDIDELSRNWSSIYWSREWVTNSFLAPLKEHGRSELFLNVEKLYVEDPEYKNREKIYDCTFSQDVSKRIAERKEDVQAFRKLTFKGRALNEKPCKVQLALIMNDGTAYGGIITVSMDRQEYSLSLRDLKPVKTVLMPRPYPKFLPYYFENDTKANLDMNEVAGFQLSIGPGVPQNEIEDRHGIAVESVRLE